MLALLALDIQKRQQHLSEIRLRERRTTLLFSVYALALWAAYVSLWYVDFIPTLSGHARRSNLERLVQAVPIFVTPIVYVALFRHVSSCELTGVNTSEYYLSAESYKFGTRA